MSSLLVVAGAALLLVALLVIISKVGEHMTRLRIETEDHGFDPLPKREPLQDLPDPSRRSPDDPYDPEAGRFIGRTRKLTGATPLLLQPATRCAYCDAAFVPDAEGHCNNCGAPA